MRILYVAAVVLAISMASHSLSSQEPKGKGESTPQDKRQSASRLALMPQDDDEKVLAEYFDRKGGLGPIRPGSNVRIPYEMSPPPPWPATTTDDFDEYRAAVCRTAGIVVGRGKMNRVFFNKSESFLITTYDFRVDRRLRISKEAPSSTFVRLAILGGEAELDGQTIRATSGELLPVGKEVVLWLRTIPKTLTFVLASDVGFMEMKDDSVKTAFPTRLALLRRQESQSNRLATIANAASTCGGFDRVSFTIR